MYACIQFLKFSCSYSSAIQNLHGNFPISLTDFHATHSRLYSKEVETTLYFRMWVSVLFFNFFYLFPPPHWCLLDDSWSQDCHSTHVVKFIRIFCHQVLLRVSFSCCWLVSYFVYFVLWKILWQFKNDIFALITHLKVSCIF